MVRFDEYDSLARALRTLLIGKVHFRDGFDWNETFETERRAMIVANHGPILGPIAWVAALFPRIVDLGFGHLTYSAIAHPVIRNIPIFARMVGFEKKANKRLRVADYVELLESGRLNVLSVAPEGEYSVYGNGVDIQPFRSHRSLEIALKAKCNIVLAVARGMEHWQRTISIESPQRKRVAKAIMLKVPFVNTLDEEALDAAERLSISGFFGRIPNLYVATELYEPELRLEDLSEKREVRDEQLRIEGERMRRHMIALLESLEA
jgi:hypothetical protein